MKFQLIEREGRPVQGPACDTGGQPQEPVQQKTKTRRTISAVLFVAACAVSPCCAPLWLPLGISLLGGAPLALWVGQNGGWIYGGLTLISVVFGVLGYRWWKKASTRNKESS